MSFDVGSSPRVRGRRGEFGGQLARTRLTPAGAGQTFSHLVWWVGHEAHPRGCGADVQRAQAAQRAQGSSPRVRGRRRPGRRWRYRVRAHPRGCGADQLRCALHRLVEGSSPRVRGRLFATSKVASIEAALRSTLRSHCESTPRVRGMKRPHLHYGSSLLGGDYKIVLHVSRAANLLTQIVKMG